MRLRPLLIAALVVAGIVAAFIVAEKKLRAGLGAEGPNGVSVEQADDADGIRIVVIRSRFVDETARYRPDGTLLSRDLKAILEDDADRIGTFRIVIKGNQVVGTERYDFDKQGRARTWTRYGTDGDLLCVGTQDEDSGVETWWDAAGKVIPTKRAHQIIDGDDAAFPLDAPSAPAAMHHPADGVSVTNQPASGDIPAQRQLRSASLFESARLDANGQPLSRLVGTILNNPKRIQAFYIRIDRDRVTGTLFQEWDGKKQRRIDRVYSPDGVLLYVLRTDDATGKVAFFSPDGRTLTPPEVADIEATNGDENGIPIPVPKPVRK